MANERKRGKHINGSLLTVNCAETFEADELLAPAASAACRPANVVKRARSSGNRSLQVFTFVLWMGCLTIGGLGFALPYLRPMPKPPEPEPVQAEFLKVELSNDPLPDIAPAPAQVMQPTLAPTIVQPSTVQPLLVAEPSPAIAFALPVAVPAQIVPAAQAAHSRSENADAQTALPPAQTLTFGRGEGKQPAPDYPFIAQRQGQQGSVKVRLSVGQDGRVITAEALEPCRWPLLNESAIHTILRRWRFSAGSPRLFDIIIRFQL
ncbi:MAG TPA: TonB family protein [Verrucomicrobiae bacterium]